jgi:lipopolysaccharide/colanic/teichoic acid biosynthesis glycosyltransferase
VIDFVGALVALAVAIAVRIDSKGGVIFRQPRAGRDGVEFRILKFRSKVANAPRLGGHAWNWT